MTIEDAGALVHVQNLTAHCYADLSKEWHSVWFNVAQQTPSAKLPIHHCRVLTQSTSQPHDFPRAVTL